MYKCLAFSNTVNFVYSTIPVKIPKHVTNYKTIFRPMRWVLNVYKIIHTGFVKILTCLVIETQSFFLANFH